MRDIQLFVLSLTHFLLTPQFEAVETGNELD